MKSVLVVKSKIMGRKIGEDWADDQIESNFC